MRPTLYSGWIVMLWLLSGTSHGAVTNLVTADDFEAYTVDELLPKTALPGVHGTYAYGVGVNLIYVKSDPLDATNNVIRIHKDATAGGTYCYAYALTGAGKTFDQLAAARQRIIFSYDVFVNGDNKNHFYVSMQYASSTVLATVYYRIPTAGNTEVRYLVAGGVETASGFSIAGDSWHRVTYDVHPRDDGSWAVTASIYTHATDEERIIFKDVTAILSGTDVASFSRLNFYQFGQVTGESFSLIDNISLVYAPLPPRETLIIIR